MPKKNSAQQAALAHKAFALKQQSAPRVPDELPELTDEPAPRWQRRKRAHAARGPPRSHLSVLPTLDVLSSRDDDSRLIGKAELVRLIGRSYPTLWLWQQRGILPRARSLRGRPVWLLGDIRHWISNLPVQRIKGDA